MEQGFDPNSVKKRRSNPPKKKKEPTAKKHKIESKKSEGKEEPEYGKDLYETGNWGDEIKVKEKPKRVINPKTSKTEVRHKRLKSEGIYNSTLAKKTDFVKASQLSPTPPINGQSGFRVGGYVGGRFRPLGKPVSDLKRPKGFLSASQMLKEQQIIRDAGKIHSDVYHGVSAKKTPKFSVFARDYSNLHLNSTYVTGGEAMADPVMNNHLIIKRETAQKAQAGRIKSMAAKNPPKPLNFHSLTKLTKVDPKKQPYKLDAFIAKLRKDRQKKEKLMRDEVRAKYHIKKDINYGKKH